MPIAAGTRLDHYEITALLGAGGMGEVYRARDTLLERDVAIKVLKPGGDVDLTSRVLREARAASALNHPNIVTIHEVGRHDDTDFIVMEYLDGESLDTVIRRGPHPIDRTLDLCLQIAGGLAAAHAKGLVHRDVKPHNAMVTPSGQLKVLDFGIARQARTAEGRDLTTAATATMVPTLAPAGAIVGTIGYIAPEVLVGHSADACSDVFALGVTVYQLIAGKRPFEGDSEMAVIAATLGDEPQKLAEARPEVPPELARIVERCLARRSEDRYPSAGEVTEDLERLVAQTSRRESARSTLLLRLAVVALALVTVAAIAAMTWSRVRETQVRRARAEAVAQIEHLADENRIVEAFQLAKSAPRLGPQDPVLDELMDRLSVPIDITSEPIGATVAYRDYRASGSSFQSLGETPLEDVRVPVSIDRLLLWRLEKAGYDPLVAAEHPARRSLEFELTREGEAAEGMARVPAGVAIFGPREAVEVAAFWLDRFEVTNRQYQAFVDAGGYEEPRYWATAIEASGGELSWKELMAVLRDSTGRPGPATWALGRYPDDAADQPVGGVTWYEAAAYAEFAGKSLPTVYHWRRAAPWNPSGDELFLANAESAGPLPIGSSGSVGRYGHLDMSGNVAEWCWNEGAGGQRYIVGGSWREPRHTFTLNYARSPLDREPNFGFRLAVYEAPPPTELTDPARIERHDFSQEVAVADEIFSAYLSHFAYDPLPLEPRLESVDDSPRYWRRETVSFTAAYGGERVIAHLFLPRDLEPPYRTVVYVPGSGARFAASIDDMRSDLALFIPRSGRALVWPAYSGTLERGGGTTELISRSPREHRDRHVRVVNDLQRTVDYLETREDIGGDSLAYLGLSGGAEYGPIFGAVERRFRTLVYLAGGYDDFHMLGELPEVQPWNYAPRVAAPTLMINGASDYGLPVELAQKPMFDALGVPPEHKRHVILEGGHVPYNTNALIRETLDWLDRYQGAP